jgi:hypothetical protein
MYRIRFEVGKGTAMFNVLVLILIMSVMALGVSLLVPHEALSIRQRIESEQALYLAEAGLEYAKAYLEGKFPAYPGTHSETRTLSTGSFTVTITPNAPSSPWLLEYNVVSVGSSNGEVRVLRALEKLATFAQYVYFTDQENPPWLGEPIWFASHDWIAGPLHTNDQIHIMGDPVFGDEVASAWGGPDDTDPSHLPSFEYYNGSSSNHIESADPGNPPYDNPTFSGGYELGVGYIELPTDLIDLETMALNAGIHTNQTTEIRFARDVGGGSLLHGYVSYRLWDGSVWGSWTDVEISTLGNPVIFTNGNLYVSGILDGQVTLGSSSEIRIKDDIVYRDATNGVPNTGCDDMLGLVSAGDVVVLDNSANSDDVIIDASIMAVSGSFRVENYNEGDPRGILRLYGGIIQKYRGPVGTGSVGEDLSVEITHGYIKDYMFDSRFIENSPPYFYFTGEYERLAWAEIPTTG